MHAPVPFAEQRPDSLFVNGETDGFDERLDGARVIRMGQHDAMDAGSQHLLEHPGVGTDGHFVEAIDRQLTITAGVR